MGKRPGSRIWVNALGSSTNEGLMRSKISMATKYLDEPRRDNMHCFSWAMENLRSVQGCWATAEAITEIHGDMLEA